MDNLCLFTEFVHSASKDGPDVAIFEKSWKVWGSIVGKEAQR